MRGNMGFHRVSDVLGADMSHPTEFVRESAGQQLTPFSSMVLFTPGFDQFDKDFPLGLLNQYVQPTDYDVESRKLYLPFSLISATFHCSSVQKPFSSALRSRFFFFSKKALTSI